MPLNFDQFFRRTKPLSYKETVVYLRLVGHYWQTGSLPTDDVPLSRIAELPLKEWRSIRESVAALFDADWTCPDIEAELKRANGKSTKAQDAANRRWDPKPRPADADAHADAHADAYADAMLSTSTATEKGKAPSQEGGSTTSTSKGSATYQDRASTYVHAREDDDDPIDFGDAPFTRGVH